VKIRVPSESLLLRFIRTNRLRLFYDIGSALGIKGRLESVSADGCGVWVWEK
jgi:hypothetical protein